MRSYRGTKISSARAAPLLHGDAARDGEHVRDIGTAWIMRRRLLQPRERRVGCERRGPATRAGKRQGERLSQSLVSRSHVLCGLAHGGEEG